MALDDDLAAVERSLLYTSAGSWLAQLDRLRTMVAMGLPDSAIEAQIAAMSIPGDLAASLRAGMFDAYETGAATTLDALETASAEALDLSEEAMTQAGIAADSLPPKSLGIAKHSTGLADDAADALRKARALIQAGADGDAAMAPLFAHQNRMRYGITTGITDAGNAGVEGVASAVDLPMVWVAERNSCVRCLAHQGHVITPGGEFPAGLTFGSHVHDDAVKRPPLHGYCRCHLEILHSPSYAEALKREAQRSVLRGSALESEPMSERIHAANKLLSDPNLVAPKSVKKYAEKAVKAGQFPTRDPFAGPADPPRPAAQSATPPSKPKPPTTPKPKAKATPKAAPKVTQPKPKPEPKNEAPKTVRKADIRPGAPIPKQPSVTPAGKISESDAAAQMFGTNSPQHKKAKAYEAKNGPTYHPVANLKTPPKVTQPKATKPVRTVTPPTGPAKLKTAKEIDTWAKKNTVDTTSKTFTDAEVKAMRDYTGGGYRGLNIGLRQKAGLTGRYSAYKKDVKALDSALDKSVLKESVIVTRTTSLDAWPNLAAAPGTVFRDKGYLSTALGTRSNKNFTNNPVHMTITVPEGSKALYLEPVTMTTGERELLLPRNTDLAVTDITQGKDGVWRINATVVPPAPPAP